MPQTINPDAFQYLSQIRRILLEEEDYAKASPLAKKMQGLYTESYLPLGDLVIKHHFQDTSATAYYRDLDLKNAVNTTKFTINGVEYTRQIFSSAPDQVMILKLTSSKPKKLNFTASINSQLRHVRTSIGNNELVMKGKAPSHVDPNYYGKNKNPILWEDTTGANCSGMRYEVILKALNKDGIIKIDTAGLRVTDASEVLLFLSAATSFNGFNVCPDKDGKDEHQLARNYLDAAVKKSYATIFKGHINDYQKFYNRVTLKIKDPAHNNKSGVLPSDERLKAYSNAIYDPGIEEIYFNYGRYLLISSSRPDGTPANLQGIWNNMMRPPWSSNFTININTQMNYRPAEV